MTKEPEIQSKWRSWLLFGGSWLVFWLVPWGKLPAVQEGNVLAVVTDMFRLGIALALFMVPGVLLYLFFSAHDQKLQISLSGLLSIGMTFSIVIVGVIGFLGRVFGMSFVLVKMLFMLVGLVEIAVLTYVAPNYEEIKKKLQEGIRSGLKNGPFLLALILATLMTFHAHLFFIDDTTYLAYLTNWQNSSQLGFQNLVHEVEAIENSRFWLAMLPMGQAILAELSGVPGLLLLGSYLELFLVPLAVLTSFWFARQLGLKPKVAGFAVLIQVVCYGWMLGEELPVGVWFYQHMAEDKVLGTFVLAPIFFVFGIRFLQNNRKVNLILFFVVGIGLTLTHPVTLFYAACIILLIGLFARWMKETSWRQLLLMFAAVAVFMAPYMLIRMIKSVVPNTVPFDAVTAVDSFMADRFIRVINDVFYGLNPGVLQLIDLNLPSPGMNAIYQLVRFVPGVIVFFAAVLSLKNIKKGPLYWYILASSILVLFAAIPYTGWILGYFVSARLISRTSWFLPLGISGALLIVSGIRWFKAAPGFSRLKLRLSKQKISAPTWGMVACFLWITPIFMNVIVLQIPSYFETLDYYKQLSQIGDYIDESSTGKVMAIGQKEVDTLYLPGVSANVRLISFREERIYNPHNTFMPVAEIEERMLASRIIRSLDRTYSEADRCFWLDYYHMQLILLEPSNEAEYKNILTNCGLEGQSVFSTKDFRLLEISGYNLTTP